MAASARQKALQFRARDADSKMHLLGTIGLEDKTSKINLFKVCEGNSDGEDGFEQPPSGPSPAKKTKKSRDACDDADGGKVKRGRPANGSTANRARTNSSESRIAPCPFFYQDMEAVIEPKQKGCHRCVRDIATMRRDACHSESTKAQKCE